MVVAGGLGPGRPEPGAHDVSRARMQLGRPNRIVFLGCTSGAGQSTVAALTARTLAGLRAEPIAVLDLNPGRGSLTEQLREAARSAPSPGPAGGSQGGIEMIEPGPASGAAGSAELPGPANEPLNGAENGAGNGAAPGAGANGPAGLDALTDDQHQITILDPAASGVARALPLADQLVLVAPASADAAPALAMTHEWLEGHGYGRLSSRAVTVINGVSRRSLDVTEQAEAVARGQCHAIVRVPWDSQLTGQAAGTDPAALRPQTRHAYLALSGVIVNALAVTKTLSDAEREEGRALR